MDFPSRIYIVSLNIDFSKPIDEAELPHIKSYPRAYEKGIVDS